MRNIFSSKWHGDNKYIERIHVFEFNNEDEYYYFQGLIDDEQLKYLKAERKIGHAYRCYSHSKYHMVMYESRLRRDV